jgi:hypothetical protein
MSIWESDQEVVKRSGRDESVQVVNTCAWKQCWESLCIAILSASKYALSFLLLLVFSSTKLEKRAEQVLFGSEEVVEGEGG